MHSSGGNRSRNPSKQVATIPHSKRAATGIGVHYIVYVKTIKHAAKFMHIFYKLIS